MGCSVFGATAIALRMSVKDDETSGDEYKGIDTYLFRCTLSLRLNAMALDPGQKFIPLEGLEEVVLVLVLVGSCIVIVVVWLQS